MIDHLKKRIEMLSAAIHQHTEVKVLSIQPIRHHQRGHKMRQRVFGKDRRAAELLSFSPRATELISETETTTPLSIDRDTMVQPERLIK